MADQTNTSLQEKQNELAMWIGYGITKWAFIEFNLAYIFALALQRPLEQIAPLLAPLKSFSTFSEVVNSAVKIKLPHKSRTRWNSIFAYILELSGDRNYLAHAGIVAHAPGSPDEVPEHLVEPKIGPPVIMFLANQKRTEPIDISECRELLRDFDEATEMLQIFAENLEGGDTSLPIFSEPISRRRPTRKQRLEAARKAQQSPPQSSRA